MSLNYSSYLKLDQLLKLQRPRSQPPEHDEMLFIVIHQVYELWFKLLLHEIDKVKRNLAADDLFAGIHTFKRMRTVMKTLVGQLDILETMTPMSFSSFRDRLETASGFQSIQFREMEFVLGYKRPDTLKYYQHDPAGLALLEERLHQRSTNDEFYAFLAHRGVDLPDAIANRDVTLPVQANDQVQAGILQLYRRSPEVAILLELMTDFDEGQQEWRYRHVKVVERTIGAKKGTGGSPGIEFLKKSLFMPIFPDLWAIRHQL